MRSTRPTVSTPYHRLIESRVLIHRTHGGRTGRVTFTVWELPRVVCGQAARARLFCNEIYNYNCKLTLSSGAESRSYGISINYRSNLSADVDSVQ